MTCIYLGRSGGRGVYKHLLAHRMILPEAERIDHLDGNGLNNQKSNLRAVTNAQNMMNARKRSGASSVYKGVSLYSRRNQWKAQIKADGKLRFLGMFPTEVEAALAYNAAASSYFGEYAKLNDIE